MPATDTTSGGDVGGLELTEARRQIAIVDARDSAERAARLVELSDLLQSTDIAFSGQAAVWLFEDVKATWIYGCFAATVLASHALCVQQLAGSLRLLADDPSLPESATSLDALAALAEGRSLIDLNPRAHLVTLHEIAQLYTVAELDEYHLKAERRAIEAVRFADEHVLLTDARLALHCSVAVARPWL